MNGKILYGFNGSEDGIHYKLFTNVKALYDGIVRAGYPVCPGCEDGGHEWCGEKKFSYEYLLAKKKERNGKLEGEMIEFGDVTVEIKEFVVII